MPRHEPTRDIFDTLTREHNDLLALLWDIDAAHASGDPVTAGDLFIEFAERLWAHRGAEAAIVHPAVPALARIPSAEDLVDEVGAVDPADPTWGSRFADLQAVVYAQFIAEELQFVAASVELEPGQSLALGAEYEALARMLREEQVIDLDEVVIELDDATLAALTVDAGAAA